MRITLRPPSPVPWPLLFAAAFLLTALLGVWAAYDRGVAWERFWLLAAGLGVALRSLTRSALGGAGLARRLGGLRACWAAAIGAYFLLTYDWQAAGPGQIRHHPAGRPLDPGPPPGLPRAGRHQRQRGRRRARRSCCRWARRGWEPGAGGRGLGVRGWGSGVGPPSPAPRPPSPSPGSPWPSPCSPWSSPPRGGRGWGWRPGGWSLLPCVSRLSPALCAGTHGSCSQP